MDEFPFTDAEWADVQDAAREIVNAAAADDVAGRAARFADLRGVLARLRGLYGEHPILLETEADFTDDAARAAGLYRQAEELAVAHHLPALSIRLSLARLLVEELGQVTLARDTLNACQNDLPTAREEDCVTWSELFVQCGGA